MGKRHSTVPGILQMMMVSIFTAALQLADESKNG